MPEPDLDTVQQRGLMLISALINFVDWLDRERLLRPRLSDKERAKLVLKFFDAHQKGENYFLQAEQIVEILGESHLQRSPLMATNTKQQSRREVAERIAGYLFTNGSGKEADRLLLVIEDSSCSAKVSDARYLGGWSKAAVRDAVSRILESDAIRNEDTNE